MLSTAAVYQNLLFHQKYYLFRLEEHICIRSAPCTLSSLNSRSCSRSLKVRFFSTAKLLPMRVMQPEEKKSDLGLVPAQGKRLFLQENHSILCLFPLRSCSSYKIISKTVQVTAEQTFQMYLKNRLTT